jgi:hypothetical protein
VTNERTALLDPAAGDAKAAVATISAGSRRNFIA